MSSDQSVKNQKLKTGTLKRIISFAKPYRKYLFIFIGTVIIKINDIEVRQIQMKDFDTWAMHAELIKNFSIPELESMYQRYNNPFY